MGPGGPACPCGEQTACEEPGKEWGTESPAWFPATSHSPGWCMPALEGHMDRDEPNAGGENGVLTKN